MLALDFFLIKYGLSFFVSLWLFYSHSDVIIAGERLQNLELCKALMDFEKSFCATPILTLDVCLHRLIPKNHPN